MASKVTIRINVMRGKQPMPERHELTVPTNDAEEAAVAAIEVFKKGDYYLANAKKIVGNVCVTGIHYVEDVVKKAEKVVQRAISEVISGLEAEDAPEVPETAPEAPAKAVKVAKPVNKKITPKS